MTAKVPEQETVGRSSYAPEWVRSELSAKAGNAAEQAPFSASHRRRSRKPGVPGLRMLNPLWRRKAARPSFEGDIAIMELRLRLALEPDEVPEPRLGRPPGGLLAGRRRLACTVMLAAAGAVGYFWLSAPQSEPSARPLAVADFERNGPPDLPLAASSLGSSGERVPPSLARSIDPTPFPSGENGSNAAIRATSSPIGPANDGPSRPTKSRAVERTPALPELAVPTSTEPTPGYDDIAALVARGRDYFAAGDVAAARLLLRRAANAGSSQAALALGGSYDPNILKRLGVIGVAGDPQQARQWYLRAAELGSTDAPRRLNQLAQSDQ
jgi:hypothetical protein